MYPEQDMEIDLEIIRIKKTFDLLCGLWIRTG